MLAFIKANYKVGDRMEITSSEGVFTGHVEYVTDKYIILRQPNGQICGIADADVRTFRAEMPEAVVPQTVPVTQPPVYAPAEDGEADSGQESALEEPAGSDAGQPAPSEETETGHTVFEPKVVGHIDLERLQQIDPKYGRRRYFKSEDDRENSNTEQTEDEWHSGNDNAYGGEYGQRRANFVSAKGRITYYNADRRYGFIHDYASDNNFYFNVQQIADPALYDVLRKGTKVAYTPDRNSQGFAARCLHLPNTFDELLVLAENQFDMRRLQTARNLVEHVLEADPDYAPAKELLEEINATVPAPRFAQTGGNPGNFATQYNSNVLYAQAKKAYLNKNFAEAEDFYLKAIDAGEKVESCVKDLVMLYVSRYKQVEDAEEKEAARQKAIDFLEAHRSLLPDNLTSKQFLALNYYLPILDFENFVRVVDDIMTSPQVANALSRRVFYLWQKSIALNKMGRSEEALSLIETGLELAPRNRQLSNLKHAILHPELFQKNASLDEAGDVPAGQAMEECPAAGYGAEPAPAAAEAVSEASEPVEPVAEPLVGDEEPEAGAPAAEDSAAPDDSTGTPQPDSWWDALRRSY